VGDVASGTDLASRYARLDFEEDEEQHAHCFSGESAMVGLEWYGSSSSVVSWSAA